MKKGCFAIYYVSNYENLILTEGERRQRQNGFYTKIRTELASGEADYVLYNASDALDLYSISQNGLLLDLREYWENDPEIDLADYFGTVLDAYSVAGKMTVLPFSFVLQGSYLNRPIMETLAVDLTNRFTVTSDDLLDWYEHARETLPELQLLFTAPGKDTLYATEQFRYLNLDDRSASFETSEFTHFLERTNAVINDDPELDPNKEIGRGYAGLQNERVRHDVTGEAPLTIVSGDNWSMNMAMKGRESLATVEEIGIYQLANFQQPLEYMAGPYLFTSTDGKLGLTTTEDFAVPASCKNPKLAWEFIKYCIRDREDLTFTSVGYYRDTYTTNIPLNKNIFAKMVEEIPESVKGIYCPGYASFDPLDSDRLTETMDQIFSLKLVNAKQYGVDVSEFLDEYYYKGLTTAQECAGKIQGRAEIWLGE